MCAPRSVLSWSVLQWNLSWTHPSSPVGLNKKHSLSYLVSRVFPALPPPSLRLSPNGPWWGWGVSAWSLCLGSCWSHPALSSPNCSFHRVLWLQAPPHVWPPPGMRGGCWAFSGPGTTGATGWLHPAWGLGSSAPPPSPPPGLGGPALPGQGLHCLGEGGPSCPPGRWHNLSPGGGFKWPPHPVGCPGLGELPPPLRVCPAAPLFPPAVTRRGPAPPSYWEGEMGQQPPQLCLGMGGARPCCVSPPPPHCCLVAPVLVKQ